MRYAVSAVLAASAMARSYAARDRPVEPHDRRGVEAGQLVVERDDLRPVGVTDVAGVGVDGVDRGEDLVAPRRLAGGEARADQGVALGDQLAVPGAAVLLAEGDELTGRRHPRGPAGLRQQHQRQQSGGLAVRWQKGTDQ